MEAILHIEPLVRSVDFPLSIGDTQYMAYGEGELDEEDNDVSQATNICLGHPLESKDMGDTRNSIPFVKTIEYSPDLSRPSRDIFSETIHYLKDGKYLIPFRTKIKSGRYRGKRINHLPNLNLVREDLIGVGPRTLSPMSTILNELVIHDRLFQKMSNHPAVDWIQNDLIWEVSGDTVCDLDFSTDKIKDIVSKLSNKLERTPHYDMSTSHLKDLAYTVMLDRRSLPIHYSTDDVFYRTVNDYRNTALFHSVNLKSNGPIKTDHLPLVLKNPKSFHPVTEFFDDIPLTDLNVDLIFSDGEIIHKHINACMDRVAHFDDPDFVGINSEHILDMCLYPEALLRILFHFVHQHRGITEEIKDILVEEPIKMKLIKTISEEALVLLYRIDSGPKDPPMCGAYFDICSLSLAPTSVIRAYPNLY
jgi:hypothetical protein